MNEENQTVNDNDGDPPIRDFTTFNSSLTDVGLSCYQVQWQRVGNMQQSAGVLMTAIAILYSAMFIFIGYFIDKNIFKDNIQLSQIIVPTFIINMIFLLLTTVFLFRVIWPCKVKGIPTPDEIQKKNEETIIETMIPFLNKLISGAITNVNRHVELKQGHYTKGVLSAVCSFIITVIILFEIFIKFGFLDQLKYIYFYFVRSFCFGLFILVFCETRINHQGDWK